MEGVEASHVSKARHRGERGLGRYPGGVWGAPSPLNTTVPSLIFRIWFGVFLIGTARRPIQLQLATQRPDCAVWTVGIASVGTESVGIAWCTLLLLLQPPLSLLQISAYAHKLYKKAQLMQGLRVTAPSFQDGGCSKMDIIELDIAPFDPPTPKTLA